MRESKGKAVLGAVPLCSFCCNSQYLLGENNADVQIMRLRIRLKGKEWENNDDVSRIYEQSVFNDAEF